MTDGLLSLSWNNHSSTFCHVLSTLKEKELYSDATLACSERFYPVHKLVLTVCSDYFASLLQHTPCKHPVIVLRDVAQRDIEALLSYMYEGSASVAQVDLAQFIKTAEVFKIKGLAVPDDPPGDGHSDHTSKRSSGRRESPSPRRKRRRHSGQEEKEQNENHNIQIKKEIEEIVDLREMPVKEELIDNENQNIGMVNPSYDNSRIEDGEMQLFDTSAILTNESVDESHFESLSNQETLMNEDEIGSTSNSNNQENEIEGGDSSSMYGWYGDDNAPCNENASMSYSSATNICTSSITNSQQGINFNTRNNPRLDLNAPKAIQLGHLESGQIVQCKICSFKTKFKGSLKQHMRRHTGERPFPCSFCEYRANTSQHLQYHERIHTGLKPYSCSFCPYSASQKTSVQSHEKFKHHEEMVNESYKK